MVHIWCSKWRYLLSDEDIYSVTNGLQSSVNETPYDYSILFGVRKMKQFGYQPKEAFKRGLESSFSDASTLGNWENNLNFYFKVNIKDNKVKLI